jgi:alkanesulfonate monooxygenase SsuD/methylene tetrahydromethanopterin reductase-like flavin-dependent oxidoreductase (luciferase family)
MKFHWFHLMPYPHLPDDFTTRYRSVWVDAPSGELYDPAAGHTLYNDYLDELEFADACGFDGICVNEHHNNAYGLMPSPNVMAGALARRTRNAKILLLGNSVALYNPPIRVAEEMAMLDVLSGGRIVAGFPVGSPMDTTFCYGQNPATLREKYREAVDLILRAWTEVEPFPFNGKYTQLRYVNPWPRPIQKPHPPVWIPGGGSVETWDWCIDNDYLYAYLSYYGYEAGVKGMNGYWDAMERKGVDKNPYRAGFIQFVAIADSDEEAERLYGDAAVYFFNRCLHNYPGFVNPPGYTTIATLRRGLGSMVQNLMTTDRATLQWRDFVERGYIISGTAEEVTQRLEHAARALNVGHMCLLLQFGNMPKETVLYNTKRFAEDVMPKLRPVFDEWEDRWWPTDTLAERAMPAPLAEAFPVGQEA